MFIFMRLKVKLLLLLTAKILAHAISLAAIFYMFWPIARWYLGYLPLWGIDFFLTATITEQINSNFVLPHAFWNYAGFAGWPAFYYPSLHPYVIHFINQSYELVKSIQYWMIASAFLFTAGSYFLFYLVSRNFVLSAILASAVALSAGVYETLTWAGGLPSFATQAFFPWGMAFLVLFLRSRNIRYLLISALVSGISIWGHPVIFLAYIAPAAVILIFTSFSGRGLEIGYKIKSAFIFFMIVLLVALPLLYPSLVKFSPGSFFQINTEKQALSTTTNPEKIAYEKGLRALARDQVKRIFIDNNWVPFYLLILTFTIFVCGLGIRRKIKPIVDMLPFVLIAGFFWFYIWLFGEGVSIYHGGWYRLFWSPPVWVGMLAAALFGSGIGQINSFLKSRLFRFAIVLGSTMAVFVVGYPFLKENTYILTLSRLSGVSLDSSAYPDIINLEVSDSAREKLKARLVPKWLDGDDTNWRLYDGDQTVNLWWNSLFKMPLARGYLDPPNERGYIFWLDAALSQVEGKPQLSAAFQYPQETAISNALFLIDWNSVRYFEGGHVNDTVSPMPSYLENFIVNRTEVLDFNDKKYTRNRPMTLNYFELKDEVTSPILLATNASTLGIFASDNGYESVIRSIAEKDNVNSKRLIPVKLGRVVDSYSLSGLKQFNALYLYDYDFKNGDRVFKRLTEYVSGGGKVFVETGVEVKNSSGDLPEFFPVKKVERKGAEKEWEIEKGEAAFFDKVDVSNFSPLEYDSGQWNVSYAKDDDLRAGAKVILKNRGKIIAAYQKIGAGEVYWFGFNQAYHLTRFHNPNEATFFHNILKNLVDFTEKPSPQWEVNFVNSNKRKINFTEARGVLFKEQAYGGWSAKFKGEDGQTRNLKIYKAGPAIPGFMYVPLGDLPKGEVTFEFTGSVVHKIIILVSIVSALIVLDVAVINGVVLGKFAKLLHMRFRRRIHGWWMSEDDG